MAEQTDLVGGVAADVSGAVAADVAGGVAADVAVTERRVEGPPLPLSARAGRLEDSPLLAGPRYLLAGLFILAVANGFFLYFTPWLAAEWYAWSIKPSVNAAALGAGYLGGMLATGLSVLYVRRWRSVRALMPPFALLGASLFLATLLHADRFRWDYFPTWVWTAVYFVLPLGSAAVWIVQERGSGPAADGFGLPAVRAVFLALGLPLLAFALWLYVRPGDFLEAWPWLLTPLLGRALAAWYLFAALVLVFMGLTLRRAAEAIVGAATLALWNLLLLLLPLVYRGSMEGRGALTIWVVAHLAIFAACAWASVVLVRRARAQGETL
jgi:hypothetical protein